MRTRRIGLQVVATIATAGVFALLALASATPLPVHGAGMSRLRLSWTARPERIEQCRTLSAEELARRGEHMRQRVECEGRFATYALTVEVDSNAMHEQVIRGGGLRHDRPLFLLREIHVTPGVHRLRITMVRREQSQGDSVTQATAGADSGISADRAQREVVERARRARAAIPRYLAIDTTLTFEPGRVNIVSFDVDRRALRVLADSSSGR